MTLHRGTMYRYRHCKVLHQRQLHIQLSGVPSFANRSALLPLSLGPTSKGSDIQAEIEALRDSRKRVALGPSSLPSICAYTFHNAHENINCVAVSEDATMMAAGFSESYVRLWSLNGEKLRGFRNNFNPAHINDCKWRHGTYPVLFISIHSLYRI